MCLFVYKNRTILESKDNQQKMQKSSADIQKMLFLSLWMIVILSVSLYAIIQEFLLNIKYLTASVV